MISRPTVVLESPYAARQDGPDTPLYSIEANIAYARHCVRDSVLLGEAPIASHLLFTQDGILRDEVPAERNMGIACGLAWLAHCTQHAFYTDNGWSYGMLGALDYHINNFSAAIALKKISIRALYGTPYLPVGLSVRRVEQLTSCIRRTS